MGGSWATSLRTCSTRSIARSRRSSPDRRHGSPATPRIWCASGGCWRVWTLRRSKRFWRTTTRSSVLLLALSVSLPVAARDDDHPGAPLDTGDAALFAEIEGKGPPLVLLPGGPGLDHAYFHPYLSSLSDERTVVYLDPRGCGRSRPAADGAYSLDAQADDLEAVRRALGAERIDLLGHGAGQAVALVYAVSRPDRVGRIVVVGAALEPPDLLADPGLQRALTPAMRERLDAARGDRYLSEDGKLREGLRIVTPSLFHRLTDKAFHREFAARFAPSADVRDSIRAELQAGGAGRVARLYARVKRPLLLVNGGHDPTAPIEGAETAAAAARGARLVVLSESGAFPFAEQPVDFVRAVREFLREAGGDGAGGGI